MSYSKSPSSHITGSPFGRQLSDGPIHDLATVIEKTPPEDWQRRSQALATLVATIPDGPDYEAAESWYNSPPTLRHLAWPVAELLKDPRSSVVIRTCESCAELFGKCQVDARYLLKDLMPTVLQLHGQTVAVIRSAVQQMVIDAMSVTPCKMVMPLWLDRLKSDKARMIREACALYLGTALNEWTEEGYLSFQIWEQVGTALTKALRDPAPTVRQCAKRGLETVNRMQPDIFDRLVENSDLVRDVRVRKVLARISAGEPISDDVSVASYGSKGAGSVASRRSRVRGSGNSVAGRSMGTPRGPQRSHSNLVAEPRSKVEPIPTTIGVTTKTNLPKKAGLGPPMRMPGVFQNAKTVESPPKIERQHENNFKEKSEGSTTKTDEAPGIHASNTSFDTAETNESELPVISNINELREFAKAHGGSRRSSTLQEHFARSASQVSDNIFGSSMDLDDILTKPSADLEEQLRMEQEAKEQHYNLTNGSENHNDVQPMVKVTIPEHTKIAKALLEAHKKHVNVIMETLKVEMDALKEFELTLLEEGPLRPTEDEVLEYFESVGLCVEQRAKAGEILQKKMDKISKATL